MSEFITGQTVFVPDDTGGSIKQGTLLAIRGEVALVAYPQESKPVWVSTDQLRNQVPVTVSQEETEQETEQETDANGLDVERLSFMVMYDGQPDQVLIVDHDGFKLKEHGWVYAEDPKLAPYVQPALESPASEPDSGSYLDGTDYLGLMAVSKDNMNYAWIITGASFMSVNKKRKQWYFSFGSRKAVSLQLLLKDFNLYRRNADGYWVLVHVNP